MRDHRPRESHAVQLRTCTASQCGTTDLESHTQCSYAPVQPANAGPPTTRITHSAATHLYSQPMRDHPPRRSHTVQLRTCTASQCGTTHHEDHTQCSYAPVQPANAGPPTSRVTHSAATHLYRQPMRDHRPRESHTVQLRTCTGSQCGTTHHVDHTQCSYAPVQPANVGPPTTKITHSAATHGTGSQSHGTDVTRVTQQNQLPREIHNLSTQYGVDRRHSRLNSTRF